MLIESDKPARTDEYCMTLRLNAENPMVASISLLSVRSQRSSLNWMRERCNLTQSLLIKIRVARTLALDRLTYGAILRVASATASPQRLQVVAHADIVLGHWPPIMAQQTFLRSVNYYRMMFALSRREPKRCFPSLRGDTRVRTTSHAPDSGVYANICSLPRSAEASQDALAFNVPLSSSLLEKLEFPPNRLGAENLLSCTLSEHGFILWNVCEDVPIW